MARWHRDYGHVATTNQDRLNLYLAAEAKILNGQEVRMGERFLRMADLAEVRSAIASLQAAVARDEAAARGAGSRFSQADFSGYRGRGPEGMFTY